MRPPTHSELSVATAEGRGSGRFVALALLDALESGGDLAHLRLQPAVAQRGSWSVDFVFRHDANADDEIIRVSIDAAGAVVSAELLRAGRDAPARRYRHSPALAAALRAGRSLEAVKLEFGESSGNPRAVRLRFGDRRSYVVELSDLVSVPSSS